jgi:hypothetical protein
MAVTTAAVVGIVGTGVSTGMSFAQAGAERRKMEAANKKAAEMMIEARKKLEVNVYDELDINKEAYELEREALLTQGATALQAAQEGSARGAAAAAGRVQLAQQAGQAKIRVAMDTELKRLEQQSAQEESRLRDIGIQLDLGEIEGAQLAARDAEARRAAATQQGMQGVVSLAGQVAAAAPLYAKSQAARQFKKVSTANPNLQAEVARTGNLMGVDTSKVAEMDATQFQDFMTTNFNADALKVLPTRLQDTTIVSSLQPKPIQLFDTNFGQDPLTFEPIKLYGQ